jgi:hypothetical protein
MKSNHDILFAPEIAKPDAKLAVALNRGKVKIRGKVSYLWGHKN